MRRPVAMAAWIAFIISVVLLLPSTGSAQTINACVAKNGNVRIVAAGTSCHPQESLVRWNSGLRVYDADGVEIGPLSGIAAVTFYVDDKGYSAGVGPDGWMPSTTSFFYFSSACTGDRYVMRGTVEPPLLPKYFFTSLQVVEEPAGHYFGLYQVDPPVMRTLPAEPVWRWDVPSAACVPYAATGTYWFSGFAAVELPVHPAPFTIR